MDLMVKKRRQRLFLEINRNLSDRELKALRTYASGINLLQAGEGFIQAADAHQIFNQLEKEQKLKLGDLSILVQLLIDISRQDYASIAEEIAENERKDLEQKRHKKQDYSVTDTTAVIPAAEAESADHALDLSATRRHVPEVDQTPESFVSEAKPRKYPQERVKHVSNTHMSAYTNPPVLDKMGHNGNFEKLQQPGHMPYQPADMKQQHHDQAVRQSHTIGTDSLQHLPPSGIDANQNESTASSMSQNRLTHPGLERMAPRRPRDTVIQSHGRPDNADSIRNSTQERPQALPPKFEEGQVNPQRRNMKSSKQHSHHNMAAPAADPHRRYCQDPVRVPAPHSMQYMQQCPEHFHIWQPHTVGFEGNIVPQYTSRPTQPGQELLTPVTRKDHHHKPYDVDQRFKNRPPPPRQKVQAVVQGRKDSNAPSTTSHPTVDSIKQSQMHVQNSQQFFGQTNTDSPLGLQVRKPPPYPDANHDGSTANNEPQKRTTEPGQDPLPQGLEDQECRENRTMTYHPAVMGMVSTNGQFQQSTIQHQSAIQMSQQPSPWSSKSVDVSSRHEQGPRLSPHGKEKPSQPSPYVRIVMEILAKVHLSVDNPQDGKRYASTRKKLLSYDVTNSETLQLLQQTKAKVKTVKDLVDIDQMIRDMEAIKGISVKDYAFGSLVFYLHCTDLDGLLELWFMYKSRELDNCLVTQEALQQLGAERITVTSTIDVKDVKTVLRYLLETHAAHEGCIQEYPLYQPPTRTRTGVLQVLHLDDGQLPKYCPKHHVLGTQQKEKGMDAITSSTESLSLSGRNNDEISRESFSLMLVGILAAFTMTAAVVALAGRTAAMRTFELLQAGANVHRQWEESPDENSESDSSESSEDSEDSDD